MNVTAFFLFLFGLQAVCLYIGSKSSKDIKDQEDYYLAGKGIRFFPLMMTFIATQVGGGIIIGSAQEAYTYGWSILFYPLGGSLGLFLLGAGIGRKLARLNVSTVAQIFESVYGSPFLKKVASMLSIISLFLIFAAQVIATKTFMAGIGVTNPLWFYAFWAIVIVYTVMGGLKAVVATDIVQAGFIMGTFLICFVYTVMTVDMPLQQVWEGGWNTESFAFDSSKLSGWLLLPLIFMVIGQDMGQRCFAAESPKVISRSTLGAGVCSFIISLAPIFFGVYAKQAGIVIPEGASVLMTAITSVTTPVIAALVACAILAAIISTADSLLNAIGSNLSLDFKCSFPKSESVQTSRLMTGLIAVSGILLSLLFDNILDLMVLSYDLSISCLFIPIFFALFKKKGNFLSAALGIIFGAAAYLLFKYIPAPIPREIASIFLSLIGYGLGEVIVWASGSINERGIQVH